MRPRKGDDINPPFFFVRRELMKACTSMFVLDFVEKLFPLYLYQL
jgi:hypothetical protein